MLEMLRKKFPGTLRGKLYDFFEKIGSLQWKKLKLDRDLPCRRTPKKIFKDQTKVDNKPRWMVPV